MVLLFASCRAKQEVVTSELEMTSWQARLEARVDSMVRTMVWAFDSLVITELAPAAPASTPATPGRKLSAKRATLSVEENLVTTEAVAEARADSLQANEMLEKKSEPKAHDLPPGVKYIITLIILYIVWRYSQRNSLR
jgi:hypothetical protein